MSYKAGTILRVEGSLLLIIAASMLMPLAIAYFENESDAFDAFLLTISLSIVIGLLSRSFVSLSRQPLKHRDGFLIVSLSWLSVSLIGALPFVISGAIPSFVDAFFESCSGFTTTGSSILTDIEALPRSILFWRSFTHWLGGMGIIVFITAVMPMFGFTGQLIANYETPGPTKDKIVAKYSDASRNLYKIYIAMTFAEMLLLKLGGLTWFDSAVHTFGTVGTGGLSTYNDSIGHFGSTYVELVIAVFMLMAALNFNLYYISIKRGISNFIKDEETKFYFIIIGTVTGLIAVYNIIFDHFADMSEKLVNAFFQVVSIITTTGYMTDDFDMWPTFSKFLIFALFFVGGCASSTGGGIKCIRILVGLKLVKRGVSLKIHPNRIAPVTINEKELGSETTIRISNFLFTYLAIIVLGTLLLSINGYDFMTNLSAAASSLGNIGPGFNMVGPTMNYAFFSDFSKVVCSFLMITGRLELFTVLTLFSRNYWHPDSVR